MKKVNDEDIETFVWVVCGAIAFIAVCITAWLTRWPVAYEPWY